MKGQHIEKSPVVNEDNEENINKYLVDVEDKVVKMISRGLSIGCWKMKRYFH